MEVAGDLLTITGTDLELTIRLSIEVGGERDGAAVVPARLVADIVKALPSGAVEIDLADGDSGAEMSISAGRSQFSVRPLSLDDYPVHGPSPAGDAVTLPAADIGRSASTSRTRCFNR